MEFRFDPARNMHVPAPRPWQPVAALGEDGVPGQINRHMTAADHDGEIGDLRDYPALIVATDYGGEHKGSRYATYAALVVAPPKDWLVARARARQTSGIGQRRISYKDLGDGQIARALPLFLEASETLRGVLVVVALRRDLPADFFLGTTRAYGHAEPASMKPAIQERALRVQHVVAVLLAGLTWPGQKIWWISDHDATIANDTVGQAFLDSFDDVGPRYIPHPFGEFSVSPPGDLDTEDLLALPDLAAALIGEEAAHAPEMTTTAVRRVVRRAEPVPPRLAPVHNWFARRGTLARIAFVVVPADRGEAGKFKSARLRIGGIA